MAARELYDNDEQFHNYIKSNGKHSSEILKLCGDEYLEFFIDPSTYTDGFELLSILNRVYYWIMKEDYSNFGFPKVLNML